MDKFVDRFVSGCKKTYAKAMSSLELDSPTASIPVELWIYDLSRGYASALSPLLLGKY